jgi:hypothetical protein
MIHDIFNTAVEIVRLVLERWCSSKQKICKGKELVTQHNLSQLLNAKYSSSANLRDHDKDRSSQVAEAFDVPLQH